MQGFVPGLGEFVPDLLGGFAPGDQVLLDFTTGACRVLLEPLIQIGVLHIGGQRRLDLHVGKEVTGFQGGLEGLQHGLLACVNNGLEVTHLATNASV